MSSKSFDRGAFIDPDDDTPDDMSEPEKSAHYRHPTVYDATAGRISSAGFIPNNPVIASTRDTASSSSNALPPESVLFKHKYAPLRYAESDIYFANERKEPQNLPESDLLKALHAYISDFYRRATDDGGGCDFKSLDGTAMIALGVLLEEASLSILGKTGDLALTEGDISYPTPQISSERTPYSDKRPRKRRRTHDQ